MAARLKIYPAKARLVATRVAGLTAHRGADRAVSHMRRNIVQRRYDTGKMFWSVTLKPMGSSGAFQKYKVGPTVPYSKWANQGRGPVYPVRAKALRFKPKGKNYFVFAQKVRAVPPARFAEDTARGMRVADFL